MPRQPRIDALGLLQHVMARGIERRKIFKDDKDRKSFLGRLALILEETQTQCYAWALIPNHFHLLMRTGPTPLSKVMRRLMTGYAVTFNKRHKRSGHLFQNRYKSIVCEEDPYLLELIRYIHLNPLRAGLIKDFNEFDKYPWCGHSVILGNRKNPLITEAQATKSFSAARRIAFSQFRPGIEKAKVNPEPPVNPACPAVPRSIPKDRAAYLTRVAPADGTGVQNKKSLAEKTIDDVLLHFGDTLNVARRRYRQFIKNGVEQGTRPELQGGGLARSAGGNKTGLSGRKKEERGKGDERILGSGNFVNEALMKAGEDWEKSKKKKIPLEQLIRTVASHFDLKEAAIVSASRKGEVSEARGIICYLAVKDLGYSAAEVARALDLRRVSAGQCVTRGEKLLDKNADLRDKLIN